MKKYHGGGRYGVEGGMEEREVWRRVGYGEEVVWRGEMYGGDGGMEERGVWRRGRYGGEGVWRRGRFGGREKIGKERKIDIVQTE